MNQTNLYAELIYLIASTDRKLASRHHWNAKLKEQFRSDIYRIRIMVEKMMFPDLIGSDPLEGFSFCRYSSYEVTPELLQKIPPVEILQNQRREVGMLIWNLANEMERLLLTCQKKDRVKIAAHFRSLHNLSRCLISCVETLFTSTSMNITVKQAIAYSFGTDCSGAEEAMRKILGS